jgi:putative DNA primase/helicase
MSSDAPRRQGGERPSALPVLEDNIPSLLRGERRWVVWKYVSSVTPNTGEVDWDKPPLCVGTRRGASSTNAATWGTFGEALSDYESGGLDGVGLVLHRDPAESGPGLVGVDIDKCRDPETGAVEPWAMEHVRTLDSYTEVSPSRRGLRIFLLGELPAAGRKRGKFEVYCTGRYVTVTGQHLGGTPTAVNERQGPLERVHREVFADRNGAAAVNDRTPDPPPCSLADEAVIRVASSGKHGAKFKRLWEGDAAGYGSRSEADLALVNYLAFYVGPDSTRIDCLFRQSGLMRPKWDEQRGELTYCQLTIGKALAGRTDYYSGGGRPAAFPKSFAGENGAAPSHGPASTQGGGETWTLTLDGETLAEGRPEDVAFPGDDAAAAPGHYRRSFDLLTLGKVMATEYPAPNWIVPGVMSEGLNILAGAPKQGKSMLALNVALTVAGGGMALGKIRVQPSGVLYLSLEDKERRVQSRARKMMPAVIPSLAARASANLTIATDWPRQHEGGLKMLDYWRTRCDDPKLVIIDVWNRFAPAEKVGGGSAYSQDAAAFSEAKRWADGHGLTLLVLHHTRKPGVNTPLSDYVLEVSGTSGISGTADGILVLVRNRQETQAQLHVTGRDFAEQELVLEFDPETLSWRSLGSSADHLKGRVQQKIAAYLRSLNGVSAFVKDIAEAVEEKEHSVRTACRTMFLERAIRRVGSAYAYPGDDETEF